MMARVLSISSQTVFGPVGNSAAVPALQAQGHEVMQIPTILLSNHPGLGKPAGQSTSPDLLDEIFKTLAGMAAFDHLAAVMTGYMTSPAQVIAVAKQIATLKATHQHLHVLVDPVIGDHGRLYVGEDVAVAMRDVLLPLATITTPNLFELHWLANTPDISAAVEKLGISETIVTSIPEGNTALTTSLYIRRPASCHSHLTEKIAAVPNGTGDYLAGCYLAQRLAMPPAEAFAKAMAQLAAAIGCSAGSRTLKVN